MNKEEFIKWLNEQPNDIQIFTTNANIFNCVDIKIFLKPKTQEFFEWYFGM